jgi:hypothetical protein
MSVLETCKRAGPAALDFVCQTLRAFCNPVLARPILLNPRKSSLTEDGLSLYRPGKVNAPP